MKHRGKDPLALCVAGTDDVVAYACSNCRVVRGHEEDAARCCGPWTCDDCGGSTHAAWIRCDACRARKENEAEELAVASARRIPASEYADPVYLSGDDRYFSTYEEFLEWWEDEHDADPPPVWACDTAGLKLDADRIVENALENDEHHEDAWDQIPPSHRQDLQDYLDEWCKDSGVVSWQSRRDAVVVKSVAEKETS